MTSLSPVSLTVASSWSRVTCERSGTFTGARPFEITYEIFALCGNEVLALGFCEITMFFSTVSEYSDVWDVFEKPTFLRVCTASSALSPVRVGTVRRLIPSDTTIVTRESGWIRVPASGFVVMMRSLSTVSENSWLVTTEKPCFLGFSGRLVRRGR